jgi:hypothetical protein
MPKSARELVNEAAARLLLTKVGQSLEADDYDVIKGKLWPLLAELKSARVLDIFINPIDEDSQDIPDHVFSGLAVALANEAASSFGLPSEDNPDRAGIWQRLKIAVHDGPHEYTAVAEYF